MSTLDGYLLLKCAGTRHPQSATSVSLPTFLNNTSSSTPFSFSTTFISNNSTNNNNNNNNSNNNNNNNNINNDEIPVLNNVVVEDLLLFTNLTYLDVSNNFLRFSDFSVLPALLELRLQYNNISKIDSPPSGFRCLQKLDLSHNTLREAALVKLGFFFQNKGLACLDLSYNELVALPKEICLLRKLETLILDNNNLGNTQLSLLGFLPSLRVLSMNNNQVGKYIYHSGLYRTLRFLSLCCNQIASFEADLLDLTKLPDLERVDLLGNPLRLEGVPDSGVIEIPDFFSNQRLIQFIIEDPRMPAQPKPKKRRKQKRSSKIVVPTTTVEDEGKDSLFLTQVDDSIEQMEETPRSSVMGEEEEEDPLARDWVPDFILEELSRYSPNSKTFQSRRIVNALKTAVLHPITHHIAPTTTIAPKRVRRKVHTKRAEATLPLDKDEESSDTSSTRDINTSRSSRSISNLSEAEEALAKMKQRLHLAEQNFENMLNISGLQIV